MRRITSNTCLAVIRDEEGKLWFAGDRRISWDVAQAQSLRKPKVVKRKGILYAGTGVSSVCSEIVDHFTPALRDKKTDTNSYMHDVFLPGLINHLQGQMLLAKDERRLAYKEKVNENIDEWYGAIILIGINSDLFELVIDNEQIAFDMIDAPYGAGCGGHLAWGSLLTTEKLKMTPSQRLRKALHVAAKVSPGCDNQIDVIHN